MWIRDIRATVSICHKVYKINCDTYGSCFLEAIGAVENPFQKSQSVNTNVSYNGIKDRDKKGRKKTHREKKKLIRMTEAPQQNEIQTTETKVSDDRDKGGTYQMREQSDPERPRNSQNPQRRYRLNWASKPADRDQKPQRQQYKIKWASRPANRRNQDPGRYCKFEWAYKLATDKREETRDPTEEIRPAKETVSYDCKEEKTYLKPLRFRNCDGNREGTYLQKSRSGIYDGEGPYPGQGLRGKMGTHRARKPDDRFKNKNTKTRKKMNETYQKWWGDAKRKSVTEGLEKAANPAREPN